MQADLLTYLEAIESKDAALAKVADNNKEWMRLGLIQLEQFAANPSGWGNLEHGFIGEDVRMILTPRIGLPTKPHAWGSLMREAARRNIFYSTEKLRPMRGPKSNSRRSVVYRWRGT